MQIEDIKAAIAVGFLLTVVLGPIFFLVIETAVLKGFKAALVLDIGAVLADVVYILLIYYSTSSLLEKIKDNPYLFFSGGVFLVVYSSVTFFKEWKTFKKADTKEISVPYVTQNIETTNFLLLFVKGFVLNLINIGVLGFWLTVIVTIGPQLEMDSERMYSFFTTTLVVYLGIDMIKMFYAKRLQSKLTLGRMFYLKAFVSTVMFLFGLILIGKGLFRIDHLLS